MIAADEVAYLTALAVLIATHEWLIDSVTDLIMRLV